MSLGMRSMCKGNCSHDYNVNDSVDLPYSESPNIPITEPRECGDTLNKSSKENAQIVRNYPIGDAGLYLADLGLANSSLVQPSLLDIPVIVTAASAKYYSASKALIVHLQKTIFPRIGQPKLIYYDLGLTFNQHQTIKHECDCEVRTFPFGKYPDHVGDLWGFAWKPIIIQTVLSEYGFVWWLDSSVGIRNATGLSESFRVAKTHGIAVTWSGRDNKMSLATGTSIQTFNALGETPCAFRNYTEVYATNILVYNSGFVLEHIMRPWVSCALTYGCMVGLLNIPHYTECKHNDVYGECHRYDQSVLSIILNRLYPVLQNRHTELLLDWIKCGGSTSDRLLSSALNDYNYKISMNKDCIGIR